MNKKQAYAAGRKAFLAHPCEDDFLIRVVNAYRSAEHAGLSEIRDTATHPAFRHGYMDASWDYYHAG